MKKAIFAVMILICATLTAWLLYPSHTDIIPERIDLWLTEEDRIITLSYRDYLAGCMFASVSPTSGEEALKAIACAMNTKALYLMKTTPRSSFMGADLSDDFYICMPYSSEEAAEMQFGEKYATHKKKIYEAVDFSLSHIITYEGRVISAQFCRFSTGLTDSSIEHPYLAETAIPADEDVKEAVSTRALSADAVMRTLSKESGITALSDKREKWFSDAVYLPSGTLKEVFFGGKKLSGEELRKAFGFRSAAITIEYTEQRFVFTSLGWGNNLGMSINGACVMARKGADCEEILSYFYHNTELKAI